MTRNKSAQSDINAIAELLLQSIAHTTGLIKQQTDEYNAAVAALSEQFGKTIAHLRRDLAADEKALIAMMKKNKTVLFDGVDVVNLRPGSLIYNLTDHVTIPRNALAACKSNGFLDVVKSVESLDRAAVEKWPDAKLAAIGAERKPKEEFKYSLKGE